MMHCRTFQNNLNICLWKWRSTFRSDFEYLIALLTCADIYSFNQTFAIRLWQETFKYSVFEICGHLRYTAILCVTVDGWYPSPRHVWNIANHGISRSQSLAQGHDACWNGEWLWTASWCAECGTWWPWYCELSVRQWDSFALHGASNLPELWRDHSTSHY